MRHSPLALNAAWLLSVNDCSLLEWSVKYTLTSDWDACGQQLEKVSPSHCTTICNCSPQEASSVINFKFPFLPFRCPKDETDFTVVPPARNVSALKLFSLWMVKLSHTSMSTAKSSSATWPMPNPAAGSTALAHNSRQKRGANTDVYDLEKGPIVLSRDSEYSFEGEPENEIDARQNQSNLEAN